MRSRWALHTPGRAALIGIKDGSADTVRYTAH